MESYGKVGRWWNPSLIRQAHLMQAELAHSLVGLWEVPPVRLLLEGGILIVRLTKPIQGSVAWHDEAVRSHCCPQVPKNKNKS